MQFIAFIIVGVVAASVNWLSRYAMAPWVAFYLAVPLAYCIGMATAFVLNRLIVFPRSDVPVDVQARRFIVINLSFVPLVWGGALAFVIILEKLELQNYVEEIAHALSLALPMLATFLLYKFFAFRERKKY